ncbi:MAG: hypothetical protein M3405_03365 [Acidobacteriota bacterium]|jgi:ankyrin repeat protein|nr:hypothetical protein [Acidobacteriota bacterium]
MKSLKFISIISIFCIIGFLTIPFSSYFFDQPNVFLGENQVTLISTKQNNGQKCLSNTIYYSESNAYAEIGEGIVNPYCAKLHRDLKTAIEKNDIVLTKKLLSEGANVNSPNDDHDLLRPVVVAVRERNYEIVKLLLDNGANVNQVYACCMSSNSILIMAAKNDDLATVKLLLSRGANLSFESEFEGYDVFDVVAENGNYEIFKLIDNACELNFLHRAELRSKNIYNLVSKLLTAVCLGR